MTSDIITIALEPEVIGGPTGLKKSYTGLSIDTRTILPDEIFFAIVGEKDDGHKYVLGAFEKGAAAVVINRSRRDEFAESPSGVIYAVDDTHEALLNLAAYIRRRTDARFAAVTGSNGKTTTKEMFHAIVRVRHNAYRSPGNLNNLYGLPISLGRMPEGTQYAIFELGISVPGEMTRLASIIKPDLAVITNIGAAHLETLKTLDNVVKAKFELVDSLPVGAVLILNADDSLLTGEAARRNLDYIGFGIDADCRFKATNIRSDSETGLAFTVNSHDITLPVMGKVNIYNALAAIAASSVWGCDPDDWAAGLKTFQPVDMRMEVEHFSGLHVLIDCYNANPASMSAALQSLNDFHVAGRKIAVLADMLELGEKSADFHYQVGREAAAAGVDFLLCLGPESKHLARGARDGGLSDKAIMHFSDIQNLLDTLLGLIAKEDLILCKGSRGMQLEKVIIGLKGSAFKNN